MSRWSLQRLLPRLWANWITLLGSVIAVVAAMTVGLFLLIDLIAPIKNAYTGGLVMVALPMLAAVGLLLVVAGLWIDRRRARRHGAPPRAVENAFAMALEDRSARNRVIFAAAVTLAIVGAVGWAAQGSMRFMDSPQFCGRSCHTVMQPQWDAFRRSPHAHVECVSCHIGSSSYLNAKVNGVGQMWKVATRSYHKPVTMPVERLLSSKQTCEHCHSARWVGNRLKLYPHFQPDRDNTPAFNALMLHVGGPNPRTGKWDGMHWHANPDVEVRYQFLDEKRDKIGTIDVYAQRQRVASYVLPGATGKVLGVRTMDCVDCHNRPTHVFDASPKAAIDRALGAGMLSAKVPFLAQVGAALLARADAPRDGAEAFFRREIVESYRREHPDVALVGHQADAPAKVLAELYRLNVYPALALGWGVYRSQLEHGDGTESVGCFRCHDNTHEARLADGSKKTLGQDCDSCHERIAVDEDPAKLDATSKLALPK